ncbi:MAG: hypothetical protein WA017_11025, partial [Desulfosalsimonadaceae bacterium]
PATCSKKDIFLYTDTNSIDTGLVQPPDKIVVRFALTIYPYSFDIGQMPFTSLGTEGAFI